MLINHTPFAFQILIIVHGGIIVATVTPKKNTPGGLGSGDVISRELAVAEDIYTVINPESVNASPPILVTEFGIVIVNKLEQLKNASLPILVTEFGIVIDDKLKQLKNAKLPILVTESGIVIVNKLIQLENTLTPILVTELPIVTDIKLEQ